MGIATGLTAAAMQELVNATLTGADVDTDGNLTLHTKAAGDIRAGNVVGPVTTGLVTMFAGGAAPAGWLLCDGSAVSRTAYAKLFAIIGTAYGTGDGTTTFNLPNLKGRIPVGRDSTQTEFDVLGESGGEKTHTLTVTEMPSHTHTQNAHGHGITDPGHNHSQNQHSHGVSDPGHNHSQNAHAHGQDAHSHGPSSLSGFQLYQTGTATRNALSTTSGTRYAITSTDINAIGYGSTDSQQPNIGYSTATNNSSGTGVSVNNATATNNSSGTGVSVNNTTGTNNNTGGDGPHNNLQPYLVMNYIIKF